MNHYVGENVRDIHIIIGGPQGSGLETVMRLIARLSARLGYHFIADREYYSNIRGRHSYIHMRISVKPVKALSYPVDILAFIDAESIFHHFRDIRKGGYLVFNTRLSNVELDTIKSIRKYTLERLKRELKSVGINGKSVQDVVEWLKINLKVNVIELDYDNLIRKVSSKGIPYPQASRLVSTIVASSVIFLMGFDVNEMKECIYEIFKGRPSVIKANILMIDEVINHLRGSLGKPLLTLDKPEIIYDEVLVVTGNEAVAMGKVVGGLRYQSYYPITPAADESFYMEGKEVLEINGKVLGSVLVIQTEDEISAIASAIGAALAGARAATTTSGPGFSLMVESLGWAGIAETPVVITYYQRGGPSTGMPTRGSQSDLLFSLFASHGEFPRIVIASGDHEETFKDAVTALNLAEKYQVPVIHLLDKFIANSVASMPIPRIEELTIERGYIVKEGDEPFRRFNLNYVISPRVPLGQGPITYYTGNEHDEYGQISEDPELRTRIYAKRMRKLELMEREIPEEERAILYGESSGDLLIIGWGSVKGPAIEASEILSNSGISTSYLHIRYFIPFPTKRVIEVTRNFKKLVFVEHSYIVQVGMVTRMYTGIEPKHMIAKITGRPIYTNELVEALIQIHNKGVKKVMLTYGA